MTIINPAWFARRSPSAKEIELFGKSHALCKKKSCSESEEDWNLNTLFAVTDLNGNGHQEYWFFYSAEYRRWTHAEEFNASTKQWTVVFSF